MAQLCRMTDVVPNGRVIGSAPPTPARQRLTASATGGKPGAGILIKRSTERTRRVCERVYSALVAFLASVTPECGPLQLRKNRIDVCVAPLVLRRVFSEGLSGDRGRSDLVHEEKIPQWHRSGTTAAPDLITTQDQIPG